MTPKPVMRILILALNQQEARLVEKMWGELHPELVEAFNLHFRYVAASRDLMGVGKSWRVVGQSRFVMRDDSFWLIDLLKVGGLWDHIEWIEI